MYDPNQPPQPRKQRSTLFWLGLLTAILLVCLIGGAILTTSLQSAAPATPQTWTTVQSFSGNGIQKTAIFTVPGDWKINWTCSGFDGGVSGAMGVVVYGTDNSPVDVAVNATCSGGSTGTTEEHQGGDIYLSIDATGDWTLDVQVLQ